MNLTQIFRDNVRHTLNARGESISGLARAACIDRVVISRILNGRQPTITLARAEQIATALKVPVIELLKTHRRYKVKP